jgi:hypothetical protein
MGLLDEGFLTSPAGIGLMSALAGGLASARRGAPLNAIGQAGLAGLMGYSNAQRWQSQQAENEQQNRMRQMQLDQMTRQQEAIERMAGSLPENQRTIAQAFPQQFAQSLFKEPVKPQLVTVQTENGPVQRWVRPGEATGVDIGAPADKESALPWYVKKTPEGRMMIDPAFAEFEKAKAASGRPVTPFFQAVPTEKGLMRFDSRTGIFAPAMDAQGKPLVKSADSPTLQGQIAEAKEVGKTTGEERTKAQFDAPRVIDNAETAIKYSEDLLKHPGFGIAVGKSSMLGTQKIPGTAGYDFINRLDQLKGGAFLEAFNTLKGGGQITEVEGKKATDAIARMDNATSEQEFKAAVKDYQEVIRKGMNRAKMKAKPVAPTTQPAGATFLGFE